MDQREMHEKAAEEAANNATEAMRKRSEENAKAALEAPQNPVRATINITLMRDGTFHMDGPWEDRMLFEGLWAIASEAKADHFKRLAAELAKHRAPRIEAVKNVPPAVADKLRVKGA